MKPATKKKFAIALGILVLLAIIAAFLVPRLLDPDRWHNRIVSELEKALGGKVTIGDMSWGILKGIWLEVDGFEITGATAFPLDFKLSRIHADVSILPLLKRKVILTNLLLESPDVRLRLQPSPQQQAQDQKSLPAGAKPAGIALPVEIHELLITQGRVRLEHSLTIPGQQVVRTFTNVFMTAAHLVPGQEMAFDIAMRDEAPLGFGALKAQGTFSGLTESFALENVKLVAKATSSPLHLEACKPYLPSSPLVERLGGNVSLTVNYEGDLSSQHRLEGIVDVSQLTYTDPSLWDATLQGTGAAITYRVSLNPTQIMVEKLALKLGNLSLSASGRVENWGERPVIRNAELSSQLLLPELIPLMPWKRLGENAAMLRPLLEGGGKIVIEQAVLPEWIPDELPATLETLLPLVALTAHVSGVSLPLSPNIPKIRNIGGTFRLANGIAFAEELRTQFGSVDLPEISARISNLLQKLRVEANVKGDLKVTMDSDEDVAAFFRRLGLEELSGVATVDSAVVLEIAHPGKVQVHGNILLRDVQGKTAFSPARLEGFHADLAITPELATISNLSTVVTVPSIGSTPGGRFTLQLQGRVDEWCCRPAIILERINTSPLSLLVVASLIPWEKLGKSAEPFKQTLLHGGTVTIEDLALPKVELFNLPKSPAQLLPRTKAAASFADLGFQPNPSLPEFEDIKGRINLESGLLTATGVRGRIGPLSLPELNIRVSRLDGRPKVAARAKGPVQLAATSDAKVEDLLKRYGLKSLAVSADMDMGAGFDENLQDGWVLDGSLVLAGVRAETYPEGVVLNNLQGRVTVNRKKGTNIFAQNIKGQVNQAPVQISGKVLGVGTPNLLIDGKANAMHLDLAHLRKLFPALKDLDLAGTVDMDLDVYIPYATARKSQLNGMLATRNLTFRLAHVTVEKGDSEFNLTGNTATIKRLQMQINDQMVAVTGQLINPVEPKLQLVVTSPNLNLDRLLPAKISEKSGEKSPQEEAALVREKTRKAELPPMARATTAHLQVSAIKGQYRTLNFQNLMLDTDYDRGVIKQCDLSFDTEGGGIAAKGSMDLRDPEHAIFTVSPNIKSLLLERLAAIFGVPNVSVSGPISVSGQIKGWSGSSKDLLASLEGSLDAQIGPGKLARIGRGGEFLARMLSLTSFRGILTGSFFDRFASEGLPFQRISAQTAFDNGNINLTNFRFESDALTLGAQGRINLIEGQMDLGASLKPLGEVSTVMGVVPLVGKVAASLTEIHFNLSGSLDDPRVFIIPGQGVADAIKDEAKGVGSIFKGFTDPFGKDENKRIER